MGASASMARGGCALFRNASGNTVRIRDAYIATNKERAQCMSVFESHGVQPTYGDGASNATAGSYTDLIYTGAEKNTAKGVYGQQGNCPNTESIYYSYWYDGYVELLNVLLTAGTREYELSIPTPRNRLIGIRAYLGQGGFNNGIAIGGIKIKISGNKYTLEEAVNAELIEPLVLTGSTEDNGPYYFPNFHEVYTGATCGAGNAPQGNIIFRTKAEITHVEVYTNKPWVGYLDNGFYFEVFSADKDISLTPFGVAARLRINS